VEAGCDPVGEVAFGVYPLEPIAAGDGEGIELERAEDVRERWGGRFGFGGGGEDGPVSAKRPARGRRGRIW
jgi:hypothetical protein